MVRMEMPSNAGFQCEYMFVCFNDDCPYYVQGWRWMWEQFRVRSSYRHRVNPDTGASSPLPVWSPTAMKDCIIA